MTWYYIFVFPGGLLWLKLLLELSIWCSTGKTSWRLRKEGYVTTSEWFMGGGLGKTLQDDG